MDDSLPQMHAAVAALRDGLERVQRLAAVEIRPQPATRACASGEGTLTIARVAGQSAAIGWQARAPLHLLVPRPRGLAAWAYAATFGGGLVAGDDIALTVRVGPGARALVATQASTKVYRSEGLAARQRLAAEVETGGLLAVLPDPVCCFAGAIYAQEQRLDLAPDASLVLVDWLSAGRAARHERWCFSSYRSLTEIRIDGRLVVRDAVLLEDGPAGPVAERMGRFDVLAVAALLGPALTGAAVAVLDRIGRSPVGVPSLGRGGRGPAARVLATASPVADGAILRVAGESVEEVGAFLRREIDAVPSLLGDDPWARKA